jgi:prephenate dehydrogenase
MPAEPLPKWDRVAIVGVGMIGGSIGLELLRQGLTNHVVGIGRRPQTLAVAHELEMVTETTTDLDGGAHDADLVIVCTPVDQIADQVLQAAKVCRPGALLTDAGSTKAGIVRSIERRLPRGSRYIGSHPLAGSERSGPAAASSGLFLNRMVVVTPTKKTSRATVDEACALWTSLGASVVTMTPIAHDRALAATSHLPHLVAAMLTAATPTKHLSLVAKGWLDTTRIASGDAHLWRQIFASNRAEVLTALARYEKVLAACRKAIARSQFKQLEQILNKAKRMRDAVGS